MNLSPIFDFLRQILCLKNDIPSHDTINRVFQILNPRQFEKCFNAWSQGLKDGDILERVIAIDGKTARGSKDSFHNQSALHCVHACSVENGISPGQIACGEKTNEIWELDLTFSEDLQRKRAKHAAANFAIVRKIGLNLLKKDDRK